MLKPDVGRSRTIKFAVVSMLGFVERAHLHARQNCVDLQGGRGPVWLVFVDVAL